jgi:hypothetical protein
MPTEISIDEPESLDLAHPDLLPANYVAAALPELIGQDQGRARLLMFLPDDTHPARFAAIGAADLSRPELAVDYITRILTPPDGPNPDPDPFAVTCLIGPETDLKPHDPGTDDPAILNAITAERWAPIDGRVIKQVVVIIDAGIAFWNPRFRGGFGPRFHGMRYLDFESGLPFQTLDRTEIDRICAMADTEGSAEVTRVLGRRFPNSIFGTMANPDPDALWHGTAIADLAAGAEMGRADDIALFGLELPRAVIADYSGRTLTDTLALILPAAIEMTQGFAGTDLTIVIPLGFPAGPQDGSHDAAKSIDATLSRSGRANIRLVVPAGNQLQDRCHARLSAEGPQRSVFWDLPPDDHSSNLVDIFGPAGQPVTLSVAARSQSAPTSVTLRQPGLAFLRAEGRRIGVVFRAKDKGPWSMTSLALWKTAITPDWDGIPFGRWTLSSDTEVELWLARDDRDPVADRGRPRRPSSFWDAACTLRDATGALPLGDDPGSAVLRTGTLSALATGMAVEPVQADEKLGTGAPQPAGYSSRREDGQPLQHATLVDDGWVGCGTMAAANGTQRRMRVSGTSAAAGLRVRQLVLPNLP